MTPGAATYVTIRTHTDTTAACRAVQDMAAANGLVDADAAELALVVKELADNLVAHAGGGRLGLAITDAEGVWGIRIDAVDDGPGIGDVEAAIADGFSSRGSLGCGLGTVNRIMDELDIISPVNGSGGTRVVSTRWFSAGAAVTLPLDIGAASRRHPSMTVNGDAYIICKGKGMVLTGVIDGLGHGQHAHRAAEKACHYLERHFDRPMESLFVGTQRSLRGTRGAVMALAQFHQVNEASGTGAAGIRMRFGAIGNIDARISARQPVPRMVSRRGIVGKSLPKPALTEIMWPPEALMVIHSDGIHTGWSWQDLVSVQDRPAQDIARHMLSTLSRTTDDATVVVVKTLFPAGAKSHGA